MAINDEIFAPEFEKLEDIYWYPIPLHLGGMNLKIKAEMLDVPVFRQPERTGSGYRTSERTPLKGSTWSGYLKHLGLMAGLKYGLTQYVWRRSLINTINSMCPTTLFGPLFYSPFLSIPPRQPGLLTYRIRRQSSVLCSGSSR